jgi:hypothetical protein
MSECLHIYEGVFTATLFSNYDEAIRVMQRATALPKDLKINYHDHVGYSFFLRASRKLTQT